MKDKTTISITSPLEMVGFIKSNATNCRFISMVSETPVVKMKKTSPFQGVMKVSRKRGMINANYNTSVRRRIAEQLGVEMKDVEYENREVWYKHIQTSDSKPLPLVVNRKVEVLTADTEYYLQFFPMGSSNAYRMPNGDTLAEEQLKPYLYKQSERPDFKPVVISIKVSNIKELRASGIIMQAEDLPDAEATLSVAN
jgi:hypothetical protein